MKNWYFIINPVAKNGHSLTIWRRLEKILKSHQVNYMAFFTEYKGHGEELAKSIAKKTVGQKAVLIAVGGDGSIHDLINGVIGYAHVTIGFIPAGSGNDFARGFAIAKNPIKALEQQVLQPDAGKCLIDIGEINTSDERKIAFVNNMGVGFDALICKMAGRSPLKKWLNRFHLGALIYAYSLLKHLFTYRPQSIKINVDGTVHRFSEAWLVTVSNQPYIGGGMKLAPQASPVDGLLDITVVHNISPIKILFLFLTVFWGKHMNLKAVTNLTGRSIDIESNHPLDTHADGENAGRLPFHIQLAERSLALMTDKSGQATLLTEKTTLKLFRASV